MDNCKRVITVNDFQYNLLVNGMNEFRNMLIDDEMPTEDVDELLIAILDTPTSREKKRKNREAR